MFKVGQVVTYWGEGHDGTFAKILEIVGNQYNVKLKTGEVKTVSEDTLHVAPWEPYSSNPGQLGWGKQAIAEKPYGKGIVSLVRLLDPEGGEDVYLVDYNDESVGKGLLSTTDFNKARNYYDSLTNPSSKGAPVEMSGIEKEVENALQQGLRFLQGMGSVEDVHELTEAYRYAKTLKDKVDLLRNMRYTVASWVHGQKSETLDYIDEVLRRAKSKPKRKWAPSQVWAACKRAGVPRDERSTVVQHYQETGELPFQTFPALRLIESWPEQPREGNPVKSILPMPHIRSAEDLCVCGHPASDHIPFTFECINVVGGRCQCKRFKSVDSQENPGNPNDFEAAVKKEGEYFVKYGAPAEQIPIQSFSINDIQREKITAFYKMHPQMRVGKINRYERHGSPIESYVGQKVFNFQYDFIIPQHDPELERLLLEREQAPYTGTKEDSERLDKIYNRMKTIGGLYLYWA